MWHVYYALMLVVILGIAKYQQWTYRRKKENKSELLRIAEN